jgi:L-alanine-DL-glutamate epimerase-like enolase superfamily enzyme
MKLPDCDVMARVEHASAELWRYRLDKPIGGSGVKQIDIIVVNLETRREVGMGFSYVLAGAGEIAFHATQAILDAFISGQSISHPIAISRRIAASFNRTGRGPNAIAAAAADVAVWDLYARTLGVPLGVALGGTPRAVAVYGSGLFSATQSPEEAAAAAQVHVQRGYRAVKPRVSGRPTDRALLRAVATALPDDALLFVDANEKCDLLSAKLLLQTAAEYRVAFVEEPLPSSQLTAYRQLAAEAGVALATGEHFQGCEAAAPFLIDRLCSVIQPDLAMMGGMSECLRVAQLAEHCGIGVAPHFLPGLFVHLAAAAPNVTWLEDFPTLEPLMASSPMADASGYLALPSAPGHGLAWADGVRQEYRLTA